MLLELRIRNFAIVEDVSLEFRDGMTAFTGETGAGKSLLLDAITLLLGAKARSQLVRFGATNAEVEGVFDVTRDPETRRRALEMGFDFDSEQASLLLVRREISTDGRNRIWVQGRSATRAQLQELLGDWIEISGQHEFLRLGREEYVLDVVDQFGGLRDELRDYRVDFEAWHKARLELERLEGEEAERAARLDYLRFQVDELDKAGITAEAAAEEERLSALRGRLGSVEKIRKALDTCRRLVDGDEGEGSGALTSLQLCDKELRGLSAYGAAFEEALRLSHEVEASTAELSRQLAQLLGSLEVDPEALETAESKLSQFHRLRRKYGTDAAGLALILEKAQRDLDEASSSGPRLEALRSQVERLSATALAKARGLHGRRMRAAESLTKKWQADVRVLGMKQARLELRLVDTGEPGTDGVTSIEALFSANAGQPPARLGEVASGGELSRIMLALKHIVASRSEIGVYLFDEVDTGIGGETAIAVAARLRAIAEENQVLVVTHLAQVASHAHHQFRIEKRTEEGRTRTCVEGLKASARPAEIARMLGGSASKAALSLAKEMLKQAEGAEA